MWEWQHGGQGESWTMRIGIWRAVVQRGGPAHSPWQATLERMIAPRDHYISPVFAEAVDARTWCLRTITDLMSRSH
ncbi:MAG TPA: hypothetical protein PKK15_19315 [Kouleothrix sp.]|nr:hypothetical protein [Kouleothrix sp.]